MAVAIAFRTASAPCPARAGPFFTRLCPCSAILGRWIKSVNRVVRSTSVPIAELSRPIIRSPSQCPGTARSSTSAGRSLIMISGRTNSLPRFRRRALGTRRARPVRRHAVNSRRRAPRPCTKVPGKLPHARLSPIHLLESLSEGDGRSVAGSTMLPIVGLVEGRDDDLPTCARLAHAGVHHSLT